tara:strand:- start:405 stop:557 length:153 start_codon:yes stop_codon:yes gene_type:complete
MLSRKLTGTQGGAAVVLAFATQVETVSAHFWGESKNVLCRSYASLLDLSA